MSSSLSRIPPSKRRQLAATLGLFSVLFIAVGAVAETGPGTSVVKAFVVSAETGRDEAALASELQAFVKREIAPYKYPREIAFVASLPKTASGKVRHVELRKMSEGQPTPA